MFYHQDPNPFLVASSFLFLIPMQLAAPLKLWTTQAVFWNLILSSASYHATKNRALFYIDQVACYALVACSIKDGYYGGNGTLSMTVSINLACAYLYYYGYTYQCLIWSPDYRVATAAHMGMHLIGSLGCTAALYFYRVPSPTLAGG